MEENGYSINEEAKFYTERLVECLDTDTDVSEILQWLENKRNDYNVKTEEIPIHKLDRWKVHPNTGVISHDTGKFFSIIGVKVSGAKGREVNSWTQPMVKQQECGIIGLLCQNQNGIMKYLLYAKYEPGNMHKLQLSPTVQATSSNMLLAHGGNNPLFTSYFQNNKGKVLVDVELVEDGGRNYFKTNRNLLIEIPENEKIDIPDDFVWVTLPQLRNLMKFDVVVNNFVRSIIGSW